MSTTHFDTHVNGDARTNNGENRHSFYYQRLARFKDVSKHYLQRPCFSHDHNLVDQTHVDNYHTITNDNARLTYDAILRAGCQVSENTVVGARAVVQGDVPAHHVAVGTPATSTKIKPGWEDAAELIGDGRLQRRQHERTISCEIETFDEFQRALTPPDAPQTGQ